MELLAHRDAYENGHVHDVSSLGDQSLYLKKYMV